MRLGLHAPKCQRMPFIISCAALEVVSSKYSRKIAVKNSLFLSNNFQFIYVQKNYIKHLCVELCILQFDSGSKKSTL